MLKISLSPDTMYSAFAANPKARIKLSLGSRQISTVWVTEQNVALLINDSCQRVLRLGSLDRRSITSMYSAKSSADKMSSNSSRSHFDTI